MFIPARSAKKVGDSFEDFFSSPQGSLVKQNDYVNK